MEGGVDAAFRRGLEGVADPDAMRLEILEQLRRLQSPMRTAEHFGIEEVIDPRETGPGSAAGSPMPSACSPTSPTSAAGPCARNGTIWPNSSTSRSGGPHNART
jgi:hypothetical protein